MNYELYNNTKELIKERAKLQNITLNEETLKYFTNYFYATRLKGIIPSEVSVETLIDNVLHYAQEIIFYDLSHPIVQEIGPDVKGACKHEHKKIYIRNTLPNELKEITTYHEIHHAAQSNIHNNDNVGINQFEQVGRMIMEGQTQYWAEEVYKIINNIEEFPDKLIPSEQLRMQPGGTIVSKLHNYEMYDAMLSKLAIFLEVPKEFFVSINYSYQLLNNPQNPLINNRGLMVLKKKFDEIAQKRNYSGTFKDTLYSLDYVYVVDYMGYINNSDKELILSGGETEEYPIYPDKRDSLSQAKQAQYIDELDSELFEYLEETPELRSQFVKYIVKDETRKKLMDKLVASQKIKK